jgi:hypothetical protein
VVAGAIFCLAVVFPAACANFAHFGAFYAQKRRFFVDFGREMQKWVQFGD